MFWNPKWFPGTNLQDLNLDWILKKIAALRGGTVGQTLRKKSNKDFDFEWAESGSGTTDYIDLVNKPRINNVELAGNKTAADLGLASASDIPVVPVQSVNGKTGAVVLSASDVGAYVKPAAGIPKTDLNNSVRTSLNKADTALQAVPPTYRTAAAQDAIDAAQDAEIDTLAGNLAVIETSPATAAHAVNTYLVYEGQLYIVTAAITAGQTLTPGTNISAVKVTDEFTLKTGTYQLNTTYFELRSWGFVEVFIMGHICSVMFAGLVAKSEIANNTELCQLSVTARCGSSNCLSSAGENLGRFYINKNTNSIKISGIPVNTPATGQLIFFI